MPKFINGVKLYDLDSLHEILGLSKVSMRAYIKRGLIKARKIGIKWYVTEKNLNDFVNQNQIEEEYFIEPTVEEVVFQENQVSEGKYLVDNQRDSELIDNNSQNNNFSAEDKPVTFPLNYSNERFMEYWLDENDLLTYISPICEDITGYTAHELMENHNLLYEMVYRSDLINLKEYLADKAYNKVDRFRFRIITRHGELRWIEMRQKAIISRNGSFIGTQVLNFDITDRLLYSSTNTFLNPSHEVIFNELELIVIILDSNFKIKAYNNLASIYSLLCFDAELSIGYQMNAITPIEHSEADIQIFKNALKGEKVRFEREIKLYNQQLKRFMIHCLAAKSREAASLDLYLIIEDIDKQMLRLNDVNISKKSLFEQYDNVPIMVTASNQDKQIIYTNPKTLELTGFNKSEVIGKTIQDFVVQSEIYELADEWKKLWASGVKFDFPINIKCKDGSILNVNIISIVERHSKNEPIVISYLKLISNEN